jgi:S1-C subfamily serine protease
MIRRLVPLAALLLAVAPLSTACVPAPTGEVAEAEPPTPVELASGSVVRIRNVSACGVAIGTGFVVDGNRIVTNRHVVEGARELDVETWDGRPVSVGTIRQGVDTDLGVIDLQGRRASDFTPLPFDEDGLDTGDRVAAIGFALAGPTVTTYGQFLDEARGRPFFEPGKVLRYNTTIEHGNSGGPLLNRDGEVVGVVFAFEIATGYGLAIPLERLQDTLTIPGATEPVRPCG